MKKIIILFLAALSFSAFAQDESQHLTFKGVPIDGTLNHFVASMKMQGFFTKSNRGGVAILSGDFAGYKKCEIYVSTLQNKDLVSSIGVIFPESSNWSTLESSYQKLKAMLTQKYGAPAKVVEEFQDKYSSKDDNSKLHELRMNRCNFTTTYITDKGQLILKLITDDLMDCHVLLGYYDKINGFEVEAAALADL